MSQSVFIERVATLGYVKGYVKIVHPGIVDVYTKNYFYRGFRIARRAVYRYIYIWPDMVLPDTW